MDAKIHVLDAHHPVKMVVWVVNQHVCNHAKLDVQTHVRLAHHALVVLVHVLENVLQVVSVHATVVVVISVWADVCNHAHHALDNVLAVRDALDVMLNALVVNWIA